jgi:hypothetical protein
VKPNEMISEEEEQGSASAAKSRLRDSLVFAVLYRAAASDSIGAAALRVSQSVLTRSHS